jgi:3-methyladenine DNA glycosylase Tag
VPAPRFSDIFARAAKRKGGVSALEALLAQTPSRSPAEIARLGDDRILAEMTRRVFYAGLSERIIDAKWAAFEAGFWHFKPHACAFMSDDQFDDLMHNRGIVRNAAKIAAVQHNARFLRDLEAEHGSAARFFADWPDRDYIGLLAVLQNRASRLAGVSAGRFLRAIGKPAFLLTPDVTAALFREAVLSGRQDPAGVQAAFNRWSAESGRDLTAISRVLAMSLDR